MDTNSEAWWPFGIFIYVIMFGMFLVPAIIMGILCFRRSQQLSHKLIGLTSAVLTPVAGLLLYMQVDRFEQDGRVTCWWWLMLAVHTVPLLASLYCLYADRLQKRRKHKQ